MTLSIKNQSEVTQFVSKTTLSECLDNAINSLSAEVLYNHPAHNFKQSGDRLRGGCPLHQSKSGSSFVVTISSKLFWCEGCQFGGGPADYRASLKTGRWIKARSKDFVEAVRELAAEASIKFPERKFSPEEVAKTQKWERRRAVLAATQEYCQEALWSNHEAALQARNYLISERGLTEEEIKLLPIGFYHNAGELKRHLISKGFSDEDCQGTGCVWKGMERYITFLWNDASGRPLTIYGRYFTKMAPDQKPKTIALPGEKTKQSPLYFDRALKAGHKEIILVEGVLDAALLQAKGDSRVCAYVGASCSGDQIETLKRRGITKVTLCGDPDHGGERGTNSNLIRFTKAGIQVYIAPTLPDGLDPDEFILRDGMEAWHKHIEAAIHRFRWKAQMLVKTGDSSSDKGKADILKEAKAFAKSVNHEDLNAFFWNPLGKLLDMNFDDLRNQLENQFDAPDAVEQEHDPKYCVTTTLDDHLFVNLFEEDKGNIKVIDQTFHRYVEAKGYWEKVEDAQIYKQIQQEARKCWQMTDKGRIKYNFGTNSHIKSAFQYNRVGLEAPKRPSSKHLRAFSNCSVDMRTGEAFPHDKDHLITIPIAAEYSPNQDCPEVFLEFLKAAYGHDLVDVIRAITSMFLDPTAPYGYFPHVIGLSGSGKGTLIRTWGEMFGLEHFRSGQFSDLASAEGRHQHLTGVSLFAVPDVGGRLENLKAFYELVDNGPMSGRALFSPNGYQKQWDTRFTIASVDHLSQENSGDGWDRRCIPLPTKLREGDLDGKLGSKLAEVKGQIISWALGMDKADRDKTISTCTKTNERIVLFKQDAAIHGDPVRDFVDRCLMPNDSGTKCTGEEMYSWYKAFCQAHGYSPRGYRGFISHMKTVLPKNFVERHRCTKSEAQALTVKGRTILPAYWKHLQIVPEAFKKYIELGNDPNYKCRKSKCNEGGLEAINTFWKSDNKTEEFEQLNILDRSLLSLDRSKTEADEKLPIQKIPLHNEGSSNLDRLDRLDRSLFQPYEENFDSPTTEPEILSPEKNIFMEEIVTDPSDPSDPNPETLINQGKNLDRSLSEVADPNLKVADPKIVTDPNEQIQAGDKVVVKHVSWNYIDCQNKEGVALNSDGEMVMVEFEPDLGTKEIYLQPQEGSRHNL
jgi:DNA primase catalytic core